ncbi:endonuclease/exonuclease/phosphatase family protein [Pseudomonas aeruginosa]|uniref:endonuclease/exonuclease/phosphatase family protein n=1 Tax=Pseudomonas aeruginosa TaxID=287 RepID=UPI0009F2234E|nr:endonuclease/exonuclease/phosphatase family protein [Pseudomonas aeruginosa]MCF8574617.1 endonuclease/exonuclease/phosphatase family protein [Pseudomonas aeruginosa]MCG7140249.1 endonuclease/exonuclease/phosphatase family protein [Pseudomonas aeruginosa]MCG7146709.1 endonuclease/exonuclease/phosphatase family protein [Pseudomonas aeruginosa]MDI2411334.1 endonuclease/exonuclease/phosphatase family protein [Pseudomonas aeruginosa]MED5146448.1 endonuclease/exonuclease/phosphatase family protei
MSQGFFKLNIAWWNCGVSPPSTAATPADIDSAHLETITELVETYSADIIALCEVDLEDIEKITEHLNELYPDKFSTINLYRKSGNSIDDLFLIINSAKIKQTNEPEQLNRKAPGTDNYLKAGYLVHLALYDGTPLWLTLSHWQSRRTYQTDTAVRELLGEALRSSVEPILSKHADPLIALCGDFNDEPFSPSIQRLISSRDMNFVRRRSDTFFNPMWGLLGMDFLSDSGVVHGTYNGNATHLSHKMTLDQIMLSPGFLKNGWSFSEIGVTAVNHASASDHLPIVCQLQRII